jgi:iron(III) transport system substrate-binding protein
MRKCAFLFSLGLSLCGLYGLAVAGQGGVPAWEAEWKRTVEAAKKEGQVTIYPGAGQSLLPIEAGVFQKKFPEIKVVTAVTGDNVRILSERRAGKYLADIVVGGAQALLEIYQAKALDPTRDAMILPEVRDQSKWWQGKHRYVDPEARHVFMFIGVPDRGSIYYNTRLVHAAEIGSFFDFLNPKWKGKIELRDIRLPGSGQSVIRAFYYNPRLGPEFIRRLVSEMDVTLYRDRRQAVDWLATGKFPICFFCTRSDIARAQDQGLPIAAFGELKEGMSVASSSGTLGLVNRPAHPNAAKVYLNWFLSREGQLTLQNEYAKAKVSASNSLRIDIPKGMVPPDERLQEGMEYVEVETSERISMGPVLKVFNEALARAGKQ